MDWITEPSEPPDADSVARKASAFDFEEGLRIERGIVRGARRATGLPEDD